MLKINLSKRSEKFLKNLPPKQAKQIVHKLMALRLNSDSHDTSKLKNSDYLRTDVGEYRIIHYVNLETLNVVLIGKRNDDEIYRQLKRLS